MKYFYNIIISLLISIIVTAVLTYILSFKFEGVSLKEDNKQTEPTQRDNAKTIKKVTNGSVYSPLNGKVIPLSEIGDGVFSAGVLGQGCGIEPEGKEVYAPFDGEVILVADTKHAIGIRSADGIEVMVHVGLDTVALNGEGFEVLVKAGDRVTCGQLLMKFDKEEIAKKYPTVTAVLVTNSASFEKIELVKTGYAEKAEQIMTVK